MLTGRRCGSSLFGPMLRKSAGMMQPYWSYFDQLHFEIICSVAPSSKPRGYLARTAACGTQDYVSRLAECVQLGCWPCRVSAGQLLL